MNINAYSQEFLDLALLDNDFLVALQTQQERELYARIISLDINELPIDQIEGQVTAGSVNIDGDSAVRRTCNLTLVADSVNINDVYWGVKTKVKIEIGLKNNLLNQYSNYPKIIWFPLGVFFLTAFNTSINPKGYTINLNGKDKMCMLNGELGGQLFGSVDFGKEEYAERVFKVVQVGERNSDLLVGNKYYFCPELNTVPDQISDDNPEFAFSRDQSGQFYKFNNTYKKIKSGQHIKSESKFKIYQKAMEPSQIFSKVTFNSNVKYEPSKYYYAKDPDSDAQYYILNMGKSAKDNSNNYAVKQLYELDVEYTIKKLPIERILKNAVHEFAKEPYHNIIINDLDKFGLEQLTYKGDEPIYALYDVIKDEYIQLFFKSMLKDVRVNVVDNANLQNVKLGSLLEEDNLDFIFAQPNELINNNTNFTKITFNELEKINSYEQSTRDEDNNKLVYGISKFTYGDDIGYRITELTYTEDLISSIGDSLTTILDKIKNMLGEFEYFYDVKGRFVFQKKPTFVNTAWSPLTEQDGEVYTDISKTRFAFNFQNNNLITAIQNSPVLTNLKNDFSVWGKYKGLDGTEYPIHARYAIDKKPKKYLAFNGIKYYTPEYLEQEEDNEDIQGAFQYSLRNWEKDNDIIPNFLKKQDGTSDWYELNNWAEKYKLLTGVYPSSELREYGSIGFKGTLQFPNSEIKTFSGQGQLIIDVDKNTKNPLRFIQKRLQDNSIIEIGWDPFQHTFVGCIHTYVEYLQFNKDNINMLSFIYKPVIPSLEIIEQDGGHSINIEPIGEKMVDWREIIYQMAVDQHAAQGCEKGHKDYQPIYDLNGQLVIDDVDQFLSEVARRNPKEYPTGYTGYEQYYVDVLGFWRQLYNPDYIPEPIFSLGEYKTLKEDSVDYSAWAKKRSWDNGESYREITNGILLTDRTYYNADKTIFTDGNNLRKDNTTYLYYYQNTKKDNEGNILEEEISTTPRNKNGWEFESLGYYNISKNIYQKIFFRVRSIVDYNIDYYFTNNSFVEDQVGELLLGTSNNSISNKIFDKYKKYYVSANSDSEKIRNKYWNRAVSEAPDTLKYWLEFLDDGYELAQFSVPMVGDRSIAVNEDKASAINFKTIPNLALFSNLVQDEETGGWLPLDKAYEAYLIDKPAYKAVFLPPGLEEYFSISYRSLSVKNKVDELLFQYAYCIENISITALPIYHLEPNTIIYVQDVETGIEGEYIIKKLTIPLDAKGTMSIQAVKAPNRLY